MAAKVFPGGDGGNGNFTTAQANTSLTINQWHHVAAVWSTPVSTCTLMEIQSPLHRKWKLGTTETLWIGNDQTFSDLGFVEISTRCGFGQRSERQVKSKRRCFRNWLEQKAI